MRKRRPMVTDNASSEAPTRRGSTARPASPPATPTAPTGLHVWLVLIKAAQAIPRLASARFQEATLGESDFRVLEVLLHKGAMPVNTIGPKVNLTPGSISVAVDRLYGRGLVSRVEHPDDRRSRIVDLTPEGRALIVPVFQQHAAVIEEIFAVLAPEERAQLEAWLKRLGREAEGRGR